MSGLKYFSMNYKDAPFFFKLSHLMKELKYAWQRAWRGYSDYDTYDIRSWFEDTAPRLLRHMAANLHSYPLGKSAEEWNEILCHMADLLDESEYIHPEANLYQLNDMDARHQLEVRKGLEMFLEYYNDLWD